MKIVCDFCKTEYTLDRFPNKPVRCAICGHTWLPRRSVPHNTIIKFIASLTAFIAACIFAFVIIVKFPMHDNKQQPLVASIDETSVRIIRDKDGANRIFVAGNIANTTEKLYGLPNIVIVSYDVKDNVISRQAFVPPVTLLDGKTTVTFNHILSVDPTNVKRVAIELKDMK